MGKLVLKSERQIQEAALKTIMAELGINDVNAGSVLDVITQAMAQEDFAQYVQIAQVARLRNLDNLFGEDLDNAAFEYGLTRVLPKKASGKIRIQRPATFTKVSTNFYAGLNAPIEGDTTINVNDASNILFGTSGTLILGRGTDNEEEVSYTTAPTDNTNYWTFNLTSGLANNHTVEETVILKQGINETIVAGSSVRVPATGVSNDILFTIDNTATLFAGEAFVDDVDVTAALAGSDGNIPALSISGTTAWVSPPFTGARATNLTKFTTGKDRESDDELRDRIKNHIQSLSRGVKQAILTAIVGLVDPVTAKRIVSANVVLPQSEAGPVKVYIDDGTGYEPSFSSKGFEELVSNASGGETRLQLDLNPLVKAQVESQLEEPYNFSGGNKTLNVTVGNSNETITFTASDFETPASATAEEVVKAINDKSAIVEARTSQVGKRIVLTGKVNTNEAITVSGGTANNILSFRTSTINTLYLYIDDVLKSKDGQTAFIDSGETTPFDLTVAGSFPQELTVIVDGKSVNEQTVTFQSADFEDVTQATAQEIIDVINAQLSGAVAGLNEDSSKIRITSNTKLSSNSKIEITGGSINDALFFDTNEVVGADNDYTLNRELGTIELNEALVEGQTVTVGSRYARAKARASELENYSPSNGQTLVISVDGGGNQTVTFDSSFSGGLSAEDTASFINDRLNGATAYARTIGLDTFLEIRSNTYDTGTIEIKNTSTANTAFGFTLETEFTSQPSNKAFKVSAAGPYDFKQGDNLVAVVNNDIVNSTFGINMFYSSTLTGATSSTVFAASSLGNIFTSNDEINNYKIAFTSGPNTTTGDGLTVTDQGGGTFRIAFSSLPSNLADFAAGDLVKTEDFDDNGNNGYFIVTTVNTSGAGYIQFLNPNGVAASLQNGTVVISQRRTISDYTAVSGSITVGSAFRATPSIGNTFIILPATVSNVVDYLNNKKITSLNLKADIEGVENNTKIQLSSKQDGSDGYIHVTGGAANDELGFNTNQIRGIQGYDYYTGLSLLAHKTIYGDDRDLETYPGVGAAGITFQVLAPTVREVTVNLDVDLEDGISLSSIENDIKTAVLGYIQNLGIGQDVILEEIRSAVIQIRGVYDVVISSPSSNIAIADNELARSRVSLISVG